MHHLRRGDTVFCHTGGRLMHMCEVRKVDKDGSMELVVINGWSVMHITLDNSLACFECNDAMQQFAQRHRMRVAGCRKTLKVV